MAATSKTIEFKEIDAAPIQRGQVTGPFLLIPNAEGICTLGHHDGDKFMDDLTETEIMPKFWAALPRLSDLTSS